MITLKVSESFSETSETVFQSYSETLTSSTRVESYEIHQSFCANINLYFQFENYHFAVAQHHSESIPVREEAKSTRLQLPST